MTNENREIENQEAAEACCCGSCGCGCETAEPEAVSPETSGQEGAAEAVFTLAEKEALEAECEKTKDQFYRTLAEYENYRKRTQKEKAQLYEDSLFDVTGKWLPLLDTLEQGIEMTKKTEGEGPALEGLLLIQRQAEKILEGLGVTEIPALGQTFDPNFHAAVLQVQDPSKGPHEIVNVLVKGYQRGERILRYSSVQVANIDD